MSNRFAKQRIIKDIENNDERIQVTGYIKDKSNIEYILLDDKTGTIKVKITEIEEFTYDVNDLINVIGDLELKSDGDKVIIAQFIQDMNKLNFEYYQKLYEIKKELE
ncbi:MAG: hypothetical protein ACFFB0_20715 [Promethearchaeota archaeon]